MKVVKITRKWKQWSAGHRVAMRFNDYMESRPYESAAAKLFPASAGGWRQHSEYFSWFGKPNGRSTTRPYFISFYNEEAVSMVLLTVSL